MNSFVKFNQLTFELFRQGTFVVDGQSGYALQKSGSYRDSAFIRSTNPLPETYKVSVTLGEIDYGLEKINGLPKDDEYQEGPQNENGAYLLAITDTDPKGHHDNSWWHQHRKLVIDVDNNVWGHGMPNPIFMVYFDRENRLNAFDGESDKWQKEWRRAVKYDPRAWYRADVEKTRDKYILALYNKKGALLKKAEIPISKVWHSGSQHEDYLVVGDPHENYYQGSMKIKDVTVEKI